MKQPSTDSRVTNSAWVWAFALVAYDFCYYWRHRFGHTVALFWAAHVVHHQSEDYNLSTALRQTSTGWVGDWIFYLPMAVLGFPPLVLFLDASNGGRTIIQPAPPSREDPNDLRHRVD